MNSNEKRLRTNERVARASQMLGAGVPLDLHNFVTPNRLIIRQVGAELESSAFDLACGTSGYIISLCITINCSSIGIAGCHLELPWGKDLVQLLVPGTASGRYFFPGGGPKFDRDLSINHLADLSREYRKGDFFQGYLLGWNLHPIPEDIRHGRDIRAFLTITDQYGSKNIIPISLFTDRSQKFASNHRGSKQTSRTRGPLLSKPDVPSYR
jgi:hypothetical protein